MFSQQERQGKGFCYAKVGTCNGHNDDFTQSTSWYCGELRSITVMAEVQQHSKSPKVLLLHARTHTLQFF